MPMTRTERLRAYLWLFFTSWTAQDPDQSYSVLDRADGLGAAPAAVAQ